MTPPPERPGTPDTPDPKRRALLKLAGAAAVVGALPGCSFESRPPESLGGGASGGRPANFERATLDAVAEVVLPSELGPDGRRRAVDDFVKWVEEYAPVAEEMHGYGYPDIRYLPPDPAPGWRAQLEGLDLRAATFGAAGGAAAGAGAFAMLPRDVRTQLVTEALQAIPGDRLPAPLAAPHVALALLARWAGSGDAWDLALEARVGRGSCRALDDALARPRPLAPRRLG